MRIKIAEDDFTIADNCGGIPRDVAKNYAFKMGRDPDDDRKSDIDEDWIGRATPCLRSHGLAMAR